MSAVLAFALFGASSRAATFELENADEQGKGFNDPTPVASIGGNPETTRGAQALAAFRKAADIWGEAIDSPVSIRVSARFGSLPCTTTTGTVIGSGVPHSFVQGAPGTKPHLLYPIALANRLAGKDLDASGPDIDLVFNGAAGTSQCPNGNQFYLGLDGNSTGLTDLVTAVLHELGHGLGMTTLVHLDTGALSSPEDFPGSSTSLDAGASGAVLDVFSTFLLDERTGKHWTNMTDEERADSARAFHQLAWDGREVTEAAKTVIAKGMPALSFAGSLGNLAPAIALATFGPALTTTTPAIKGPLTAVDDPKDSPTDACQAPARIDGKIAFIEAGGCPDVEKVLSVQGAGAIAAILVNDQGGPVPFSPTGTDDMKLVTIPSLRITQEDAEKIRVALGAAPIATIRIDAQRGVGTSVGGRVYLDATNPVQIGVSVAHWDPTVTPHLLMHPTLETSQALDLTVSLMHDLGWRPFRCGDGFTEGTEECDDGPNAGSGSCSAACTLIGGARDGGATPRDGGTTIADAGDASRDASGAGDATPIVVPPNRYLDAAASPAPNFNGIVWAPKHGSCSCRIGAEGATREQPVGRVSAALALAAFLRRRFAKKASRTTR